MNSNGLISFLTSLPNFINVQFPLDHPVIAPFYANTDLRASGSVFYRETQNELPRARITAEIRQSFPYSQFSAESVFVATWYRVGYFNLGADKVNSDDQTWIKSLEKYFGHCRIGITSGFVCISGEHLPVRDRVQREWIFCRTAVHRRWHTMAARSGPVRHGATRCQSSSRIRGL